MKILLVDDANDTRLLLKRILEKAGYKDLLLAESAPESFQVLDMENPSLRHSNVDLILMDIMMPEIDGIEACRRIKEVECLRDIPIIMVTAKTDNENLQMAFEAGAIDYVTKPFDKVELLARVRSALRLKEEMDRRMKVTLELEAANHKLQLLSSLDGLTGIANRRHFDEKLHEEWQRALRHGEPLSLILMDIDFFKPYNDNYGHQAGDDCLKKVAKFITGVVKRPSDLVARYGGEEFVVVLPETPPDNAKVLAEQIRTAVESERVPHEHSKVAEVITVSVGVSSTKPERDAKPEGLIEAADQALYKAKHGGRNRVELAVRVS